jgi:hypothetical protein
VVTFTSSHGPSSTRQNNENEPVLAVPLVRTGVVDISDIVLIFNLLPSAREIEFVPLGAHVAVSPKSTTVKTNDSLVPDIVVFNPSE